MDVKGFGNQKSPEEIYRGSDYTAEFVPMVLIVIVVADSVPRALYAQYNGPGRRVTTGMVRYPFPQLTKHFVFEYRRERHQFSLPELESQVLTGSGAVSVLSPNF
jgi:hypothetical protein